MVLLLQKWCICIVLKIILKQKFRQIDGGNFMKSEFKKQLVRYWVFGLKIFGFPPIETTTTLNKNLKGSAKRKASLKAKKNNLSLDPNVDQLIIQNKRPILGNKYTCDLCGKTFPQPYRKNRHVMEVHKKVCITLLDIIFHQITTFIKVRLTFVCGIQTLQLIDFTKLFFFLGKKAHMPLLW